MIEVVEVLRQLEELGVTLVVAGDRLRYRPASRVPADLVEVLRAHKEALMAHLRYFQKYPGAGPPGDVELREIDDRVHADGVVLLWSTVLQDFIAFYVAEGDKAKIPPGFVPYSLQELERLFGDGDVAASTLRLIHQAKKLGGGTVTKRGEQCPQKQSKPDN